MGWTDDIAVFLESEGFGFSVEEKCGIKEFRVHVDYAGGGDVLLNAVPALTRTLNLAENILRAAETLRREPGKRVFVPQDFWMGRGEMVRKRLLAQLGRFRPVFARNTVVRRLSKPETAGFLDAWHSYGDATARYRYGMFGKDGELLAVATFSAARKWLKDNGIVRSCEWVRYASLPDVRVVGGMGKVLKTFVRDVGPDDVMSYADLEWTDGSVYEALGFVAESFREPVLYFVDPETWKRVPCDKSLNENALYHYNLGSVKYRMKL